MLGYAGIILEETVAFNKSGVALLMAAGLWTIRAFSAPETVRALPLTPALPSHLSMFTVMHACVNSHRASVGIFFHINRRTTSIKAADGPMKRGEALRTPRQAAGWVESSNERNSKMLSIWGVRFSRSRWR
jgi:hypothetical protein